MTYAELAKVWNISLPAARRLTRHHHWHEQVGNDGVVIVSFPLSALEKPGRPVSFRDPGTRPSTRGDEAASDTARAPAVRALERAVEGRCAPDRAEQWPVALRAEFAGAQAAERNAIELVKYITAEASELRKRADDVLRAERIARDEAAGLRAGFDARRQWGLRRRLRWALSRKR